MEAKASAEAAAAVFMRSQQDLASLVHCGQELQECFDLTEACNKIVEALNELGLDCAITFVEDKKLQQEIRGLALATTTHFKIEDYSARLYFAQCEYAGYISARTRNDEPFDAERFSDLLHLFKNQLCAFLERLVRAEEREKLLVGYKNILSKLEEIIRCSDFSAKSKHVRIGIENDTEGVFDILDKIREKVPEEIRPWTDEAEIQLQFADRVTQQINHLAGVLRELIRVLNPELAILVEEEDQVSSQGICAQSTDQNDINGLLNSLGL